MLLIKIWSYLLSLFPLILILLLQQNKDFFINNKTSLFVILWIYLIIILISFLRLYPKMKIVGIPVELKSIKKKNWEQLAYFMTYIIPFITLDITKSWQLISLWLIILFIWILYIKTNLYLSNPVLSLVGFNIYNWSLKVDEIEVESIILSRKDFKDILKTRSIKWNYILEDEAVFISK